MTLYRLALAVVSKTGSAGKHRIWAGDQDAKLR